MNLNLLGVRLRIELPNSNLANLGQQNGALRGQQESLTNFKETLPFIDRIGNIREILSNSHNDVNFNSNLKIDLSGSYPITVLNEPKFQEQLRHLTQFSQNNLSNNPRVMDSVPLINFQDNLNLKVRDFDPLSQHQVSQFNVAPLSPNLQSLKQNPNQSFIQKVSNFFEPIRRPYESTNLKGENSGKKKKEGSKQNALLPKKNLKK